MGWDEYKNPYRLLGTLTALYAWYPTDKVLSQPERNCNGRHGRTHGLDDFYQQRRSESASVKANILGLVYYTNH
jgi:hypothetical protein